MGPIPDQDPVSGVQSYLRTTERRQVDEAQSFLASPCRLVLPGGEFSRAEGLIDFYASVIAHMKKDIEAWETTKHPDGSTVVRCEGTLSGETRAGEQFRGVRFTDKFIIRDGRISEQHVFNDLAIHGLVPVVATSQP